MCIIDMIWWLVVGLLLVVVMVVMLCLFFRWVCYCVVRFGLVRLNLLSIFRYGVLFWIFVIFGFLLEYGMCVLRILIRILILLIDFFIFFRVLCMCFGNYCNVIFVVFWCWIVVSVFYLCVNFWLINEC